MRRARAAACAAFVVAAVGCSDTVDRPSRSARLPGVRALSAAPVLGENVTLAEPPPPISGGTLTVSPDGRIAVASDPDRDRVYVVDLESRVRRHSIELPRGAEPGRVAIDDRGRAHVALRRSGALAVIDMTSGSLTTRDVCTAPRGVVFDRNANAVRVACASGEVVTIPSNGSEVSRERGAPDYRDILVRKNGTLQLSRFRRTGPVTSSSRPTLVWRAITVPAPDCETCADVEAEVSQQPRSVLPSGGYSGAAGTASSVCGAGSVMTTRLDVTGHGSLFVPEAVLPVDLASNGREFVIVAAGNAFNPGLPQLFIADQSSLDVGMPCGPTARGNVPGQAIAAAFAEHDTLLVQTREPAALHFMTPDRLRPWRTIELATESRHDTGHALFHANASGLIACASCHGEGGDDGLVWQFEQGERRTPSLLGTLADTEPFHWSGDLANMRALVDDVFTGRMGGEPLEEARVEALRSWLKRLPAPPSMRTPDATTERGSVTFASRCASCHRGASFTNNQNADVGTGGAFQVPSLLGVAWRAPFLHTGCANTLLERFDPRCGGGNHGDQGLSSEQQSELAAYLETL